MLLRYAAPGIADALTRLFFEWAGSITNTSLNNYATQVATNWNTDIAPLVPSAMTLTEVSCEDLTTPTGPVGVWSGSHAGTRATGAFAPATAFIITDSIARRYRGGHPRKYLLGMDSSQTTPTDGNTWLSTYASGVVTNWNTFLTSITGANGPSGTTTWVEVNVSYYQGSTATTVGTSPYVRGKTTRTLRSTPAIDLVAGHSYNPQIGSQRRRNKQSS